jgi:hypothetical protein
LVDLFGNEESYPGASTLCMKETDWLEMVKAYGVCIDRMLPV